MVVVVIMTLSFQQQFSEIIILIQGYASARNWNLLKVFYLVEMCQRDILLGTTPLT